MNKTSQFYRSISDIQSRREPRFESSRKGLRLNGSFFGLLIIFVAMLFVAGCGEKQEPQKTETTNKQPTQEEVLTAVRNDTIRQIPAEQLATLGSKNTINTDFVYPNAHFARLIHPSRFIKYPLSKDILNYFQMTSAPLPFTDQFADIDYIVLSTKIFLADLKDPKTGQPLGQQFDTPLQAFYVKKSKPFDKEKQVDLLFKGFDRSKVTQKKYGSLDVSSFPAKLQVPLDEKGEKTAALDLVQSYCFPTDDSFVIAVGPQEQIDLFYSDLKGDARGVVAQRVARIDDKNSDFAFIYDYSHPLGMANSVMLFPQNLMQMIAINSEAVTININTQAKETENLLRLVIAAKPEADIAKINTEFSAFLMDVDQKTKADAEKNKQIPAFIKDLGTIIKNIKIEQKEPRTLVATITNTSDVQKYCTSMIGEMTRAIENMKKVQYAQALEGQIGALASVFTKYFSMKNKFPPLAIKDAKGTPVLSWRVALLPAFGPQGEELYKQFKLDEPWNGPNNIKLLSKIPRVFQTVPDAINANKTTFQILASPGTPYAKNADGPDLKQIENPAKTFLVVAVDQKKAIEWTKPDELLWQKDKMKDIFGDFVIGIPFMGNPSALATATPNSAAIIDSWFTGKPLPSATSATPATKPAAPAAKPVAPATKPAAPAAKPVAPATKPATPAAKPGK